MGSEVNAWGEQMVKEEAWLMHLPTLTIGRVVEFFDGVDHIFQGSSPDSVPLHCEVVKFSTGHTFVAKKPDAAFLRLEAREVAFVQQTQPNLGTFVSDAAMYAQNAKIPARTFAMLMVAILRTYATALETTVAESNAS